MDSPWYVSKLFVWIAYMVKSWFSLTPLIVTSLQGNIDEGLYSVTPDNSMPLTKLGWEQARKAGKELKDQVLPKGETVHFIVSPYVRTVETFHGIVSAWCDPDEFKYILGTSTFSYSCYNGVDLLLKRSLPSCF